MPYQLTREDNIKLLASYKKTLIENPDWVMMLYHAINRSDRPALVVAGQGAYYGIPQARVPFAWDMERVCNKRGIDITKGVSFSEEIWEEMKIVEFIITLYQATHL